MLDNATNPAATMAVPDHCGEVRPQLLVSAHDFLAYQCSNPHMQASREADRARLMGIDESMPDQQEGMVNLLLERDAVERNRTKLKAIRSVFLPDQADIQGNPLNFLKIQQPYAKSMPVFFPSGQDDFDSGTRNIVVSETEFVTHYLRYARKELAEFSPFLFHSLYRIEMARTAASVHVHHGYSGQAVGNEPVAIDPGSKFRLMKLAGSSSYYTKIHKDLQAKCDDLGYPEFFYTFTNTDRWDVTLATMLSQDGFDVWHEDDEGRRLPGTGLDSTSYFVHLPCLSESALQNCTFHSCKLIKCH